MNHLGVLGDTGVLAKVSGLFWLWAILSVGGLMAAGAILIVFVRKRMRSSDDRSTDIFTLGQLRKMHADGQISSEEYESLRDAMIGQVRNE